MTRVAPNQYQFSAPPLFAPSHSGNTATAVQKTSPENLASYINGTVEDYPLDLDLLAEYLLDDNANNSSQGLWFSATPPMLFDVSGNMKLPAQLATPEDETELVLEESAIDISFADGRVLTPPEGTIAEDIAQVQEMIAQHAARAEATAQAKFGNSIPSPVADVTISSSAAVPTSCTSSTFPHGFGDKAVSLPQAVATGVAKRSAPAVLAGGAGRTSRRRPKSEAQVNRRRERNRVLARRTRLRKKFFFEGLQKEVMDLQREHNALKSIVRRNLEQNIADEILKDTQVELPNVIMENYDAETGDLDRQDFTLIRSLQSSQQCFIITDPSLLDNPIVYASEGFLSLTKYAKDEILGRNCRFLQGPETSPEKVEKIRNALAVGHDVSVCIANYTADGEAFWNQLFVAALRDVEDNVVNFVGVVMKVSRPGPDDPEHNKILNGLQQCAQENVAVKG